MKKIKDIKNSEGLIISEEKSDDPNITDIKTQKKLELERFKVFLKACVDLKEIDSYPISFLPGEGSLGPEVINLNP